MAILAFGAGTAILQFSLGFEPGNAIYFHLREMSRINFLHRGIDSRDQLCADQPMDWWIQQFGNRQVIR